MQTFTFCQRDTRKSVNIENIYLFTVKILKKQIEDSKILKFL